MLQYFAMNIQYKQVNCDIKNIKEGGNKGQGFCYVIELKLLSASYIPLHLQDILCKYYGNHKAKSTVDSQR